MTFPITYKEGVVKKKRTRVDPIFQELFRDFFDKKRPTKPKRKRNGIQR